MDDRERIQKHHGGPHTDGTPKGPYWKRMHRSAFFWVAAVFLLLGIGIFIFTDGFLLRPRGQVQAPDPTRAP